MKTITNKNPNTRKTIKDNYPEYKKYSGTNNADIKFVGNCSVAMIDNVLSMKSFSTYENDNQTARERKLRNGTVPLEFEEVIRLKQRGRKRFKINFNTKRSKMSNDKLLKEWENKVVVMDCVEGMKQLPDNSVDLFLFSPPYDALREYNGKPEFDLHATGVEIKRILKEGGMCAMVIQDQTKNFGKSLTSFKTAVDWVDNIGFKLFECVIYRKNGTEGAWWKKRFRVDHEYIHLFLKGEKPAYFDKEGLKVPSKHGGKMMTGFASRKTDGTTQKSVTKMINPTKCRGTIWDYMGAGDKNPVKRKHPAPFPDKIPYDIIQCFCPEGGLVIDPFIGSGSTAVAAVKLNRNFIGFDISPEYVKDVAEVRIAATKKDEPVENVIEEKSVENASVICQYISDILESGLDENQKSKLIDEIMATACVAKEKISNLTE